MYKEPLRIIGWKFTLFEVIDTIQVHLDFTRIKVVQEHQNFAMILSEAFGGESTSQGSERFHTKEEILQTLARMKG